MPLSNGDKLGAYEILAQAGEGGMGQVYKARDTRLERTVALKILTSQSERFEREARTVASLNHPNICVLHDIGAHNGTPFMVMEFLEGQTLADRIAKGPLPLDELQRIATQVGDALDRAHRAGVTHRDIKPGNIMLTRDGAKVLDFGLAKVAEQAAAAAGDATLTKVLSGENTVMGTPQYMAPELFEGKPADARSDIWAFGSVLYEMATGKKAFEGSSYASLVGAILGAEPKPMQPLTPPWLERLVRRCLAKDPEERYQSIRDIVLDLRYPPAGEITAAAPKKPWAVAAACMALALCAAAGWAISAAKPTAPAPATITEINPPESGRFAPTTNIGGSAISPDGRMLAYVALVNGQPLLHVRRLDTFVARALPGTEEATRPFWSPDGKSIAFGTPGKLKRVDLAGGAPVTLADVSLLRGGSWSEDGTILFAERSNGVMRVPAGGGPRTPVTTLDRQTLERHYYPEFLPGGKTFLYLIRGNQEKRGVYVASLDGRTPPVRILEITLQARYDAATRSLLYVENGTLMARRLELDPPRLTGDPRRIAEDVSVASGNGYTDFSVSGNGVLFYRQGTARGKTQFAWFDRSGRKLETLAEAFESSPSLFSFSPDGGHLAFTRSSVQNDGDIWLLDLRRGTSTRLSFQGGRHPLWTPDGKNIYYRCPRGICRKPADGAGDEEVASSSADGRPTTISPDGATLMFGLVDIFALRLGSAEPPRPWLQTPFEEDSPAFSPDGRWVAYESSESGGVDVYVQAYPERRGKWQVSHTGGRYPHWRADGRELYWVNPDNLLMAAPVTAGPAGIEIGKATPLFTVPAGVGYSWFELDRDGKRFLVAETVGVPQQELPMMLVQNWPALAGVQE